MLKRFSWIYLSTLLASAPALGANSLENRKDQAVELMFGSYGYAVGLITSDKHVLELGYTGLEIDEPEEDDEDQRTRWSQGLFLHSRNFHKNSFNTMWGVSWEDSGFGQDPYKQSERSLAFLDLALGNQWSWKHFTLGADWIGMGVPVFERVRVKEDGTETDERAQRFATRAWQGVEVRMLNVYCGLVF